MKHVDACVMSFLFIKRSLSLSFDGHSAPPALLPLAAGYATTTLPCPALTHCTEPPSTDFYRTVLPMLCVCVCASVCVCVCVLVCYVHTTSQPASQPILQVRVPIFTGGRESIRHFFFSRPSVLSSCLFSSFLLPLFTLFRDVSIYSRSVGRSVF